MLNSRGIITLMGSGELTATMVEVHKRLLRKYGDSARAVFIDTPAGFQLNADQISRKAVEFFKLRVQHSLTIASFKSAGLSPVTAEQGFDRMRCADYLLVGPGSPTYALRQWQQSPVPDILVQRIAAGGCLVAASAAALTIGRLTLPVYEIYKVGDQIHWVNGLNLLERAGMDLAVIPHWNNAEGGNHDTRYCFMGAERLQRLIDQLPQATQILGLDEHTALIVDLAKPHATVQGQGTVTLKNRMRELSFAGGDRIPLALLRGEDLPFGSLPAHRREQKAPSKDICRDRVDDPWVAIHAREKQVCQAVDDGRDEAIAQNLLELERLIWRSREQLEEQNAMGAAREVLRNVLAVLTAGLAARPKNRRSCLERVVSAVLRLRDQFRFQKKWEEADAVRACLETAGIRVTDSEAGVRWALDE